MSLDFSQLSLPKVAKAATDPFKIFGTLPRLDGAPNDLWRGQAEALTRWNDVRESNDSLISLNTGAGKTLVGLLIAKSFTNEGLDNVLYVCPTIDLVKQTAMQARAIGIEVTTRTESDFDNDLFESGKTFCITSYAALFNGHSALRRRFFPEAIIFDDAHVAEATMRDAFTLSIDHRSHPDLFSRVASIYLSHFRGLNRENKFRESLEQQRRIPESTLVPPDVVLATFDQLSTVLRSANVAADKNLTFPYEHLKDRLGQCAVVFRAGKVDITPPFLPSLALDIFARRVRRVYLSATLHNKADIVRAFGREPDHIIEPSNDAGNGERLVVFERGLGVGEKFDASFGRRLAVRHKVLVSVPGYHKTKDWETLATPASREQFSDQLEAFRRASSGSFILVSRVDGIDLPNDTCRLMVIDGLPRGESLLEKYQFEYLHMHNFAASRVANRLVQLFGRINRGRSDYGAFLIAGHDLNVWLNKDKNVALLPDLLRNQILLGRHVQEGMNIRSLDSVDSLLQTVLLSRPRDQSWLNYYSQFLEANEISAERTDRAVQGERRNFAAAKAEALYARHMWEGNYAAAREALDAVVADVARSDEKLAGWHNLWIGACLHHEGDVDEARFYYAQARGQLGLNLIVDTGPIGVTSSPTAVATATGLIGKVSQLTNLGRESFEKQLAKLERMLEPLAGGSPAQMEEAVRTFGDSLGFIASRPDNDVGTGPDVLWIDQSAGLSLGLELKTDKAPGSEYSKSEVSQSLDHLSWLTANSQGTTPLGIVLVGPDAGVSHQANPTGQIFSVRSSLLRELRDQLLAGLRDVYRQTPTQRPQAIERTFGAGWSLRELATPLCANPLRQSNT